MRRSSSQRLCPLCWTFFSPLHAEFQLRPLTCRSPQVERPTYIDSPLLRLLLLLLISTDVVSNYYNDISVLCVGLVCSYAHTVLTADCKLNRPAGTLALYLLARTPAAAATLVHHIVFVVFLLR